MMKSDLVFIFLLVLLFSISKTYSQTREETKQIASQKSTNGSDIRANVEVQWNGSGSVNIMISNRSYFFRGGQSTLLKLEVNSNLELFVLKQGAKFTADKFVVINPAGGYLVINLHGEQVVFSYIIPRSMNEGKAEDSEEIIDRIASSMVHVQGGSFTMGCTSNHDPDCFDGERPSHRVTVSDFSIGKYEVTQEQWDAVMGMSSSVSNPKFGVCQDCPVDGGVSWEDTQSFIRKLNEITGKNYRLPTEAEWEYAARGGNKSRGYKYSGSRKSQAVAVYSYNSGGRSHRVGIMAPNEIGVYDMSGNVWEWCNDWYGVYGNADVINPRGPSSGSYRVARGGSWSGGAEYCRVTSRNFLSSTYLNSHVGFRLAL